MPADILVGAEVVAAENAIMRGYNEAKKAIAAVKRHAKIMKRLQKKRSYRLFETKVKPKNYGTGFRKNENHSLVKLPVEIKKMIFKALPTAADRACLALTCKDQAAIYDKLADEKNKKEYLFTVPKQTTLVHRLLLLIRLKTYMTSKYRLCYQCVQFIDHTEPVNGGQWGGSEERVKNLVSNPLTARAAMVEGPRCPLCRAASQMEAVSYKSTYKKYLALSKDI